MNEQPYEHWQYTDDEGRPAGGRASGVGLAIEWQNGPLGRGEDRIPPNGTFVETVIRVARDRLEFYQAGQFACEENAMAKQALESALHFLSQRTARREQAGVEGTHEGS